MDLRTDKLIHQGREAFECGDYATALADFQEVLEEHPTFADIHHLAGICLGVLGNAPAAVAEFDQVIALNGDHVEAHINRGITLNELGRSEEARAAFERAHVSEATAHDRFDTVMAGRLANAHLHVGDIYLAAGAGTEAAEQYRAALELRPMFLDIRHKLGRTLMHLGELDAAQAELEKALESNPRFLTARLNLGLVHYRRGDIERARAEWQECRAQDAGNPQVRTHLALLDRNTAAHAKTERHG